MLENSISLNDSVLSQFVWLTRATVGNGAKAVRYFISLMKEAAARERGRKEMASLDLNLLQDIGLEPFDVYYGWRGPGR